MTSMHDDAPGVPAGEACHSVASCHCTHAIRYLMYGETWGHDCVQTSQADMLAALRREVAAAEQRVQEERDAHASARSTFVAREAELEANLAEAGAALAAMQRSVDDKSTRCAAAEVQVLELQRERTTFVQQAAKLRAALAERCRGLLHCPSSFYPCDVCIYALFSIDG